MADSTFLNMHRVENQNGGGGAEAGGTKAVLRVGIK